MGLRGVEIKEHDLFVCLSVCLTMRHQSPDLCGLVLLRERSHVWGGGCYSWLQPSHCVSRGGPCGSLSLKHSTKAHRLPLRPVSLIIFSWYMKQRCCLTQNLKFWHPYDARNESIPFMMMPWLCASPGHQQSWYYLFMISMSFSPAKENNIYPYWYTIWNENMSFVNDLHAIECGAIITLSILFQIFTKNIVIDRPAMRCILWFKLWFILNPSHCYDVCNIMLYWTAL